MSDCDDCVAGEPTAHCSQNILSPRAALLSNSHELRENFSGTRFQSGSDVSCFNSGCEGTGMKVPANLRQSTSKLLLRRSNINCKSLPNVAELCPSENEDLAPPLAGCPQKILSSRAAFVSNSHELPENLSGSLPVDGSRKSDFDLSCPNLGRDRTVVELPTTLHQSTSKLLLCQRKSLPNVAELSPSEDKDMDPSLGG